jgi:hypothetical protein
MTQLNCKVWGKPFDPYHSKHIYCSYRCRDGVPAVYRFISPDGRSYVGAVTGIRNRDKYGIYRSNSRLLAAFKQYPPETFVFEVLEKLPYGCSARELNKAEQRHIDRLRSWSPEAGFNIMSAATGQLDRRGSESL